MEKKIFALCLIFLQVSANLLNTQKWAPNNLIVAGKGVISGSTAISDNQSIFSLVITTLFLNAPGPFTINLQMPDADGNGQTEIQLSIADNELNFSTTTANGSKVIDETYIINDNCKLTRKRYRDIFDQFVVSMDDTCIQEKTSTIVLQSSEGGSLGVKAGAIYQAAKLSYQDGDTEANENFDITFAVMDYENVPATQSMIGFNEQPWSLGAWRVSKSGTLIGAVSGYTSLAPLQFGATRDIAFFFTLKGAGTNLMPSDKEWAIEWELPLADGTEEAGVIKIEDGNLVTIQQITLTAAKKFKEGSPLDKHFYEIVSDTEIKHVEKASSSEDFNYWRIFVEHTHFNLNDGNFVITLTRNAGDQLDLKSNASLQTADFYYEQGGARYGSSRQILSFDTIAFGK